MIEGLACYSFDIYKTPILKTYPWYIRIIRFILRKPDEVIGYKTDHAMMTATNKLLDGR